MHMAGQSIKDLEWTHRFVAVFKCYRRREEPQADMAAEELTVADGDEIKADANLRRVLGTLQGDLVQKRIYRHAENPTSRLLTFKSYPDGTANEGQACLDALLRASDRIAVQQQALALAERYRQIPGVREGILIFLVSRGGLGEEVAGDCVFVFKCNFEAISQIAPDELFRRVEDAIVEQTKKGALYPYFVRGQFDYNTIRVFDELGETHYWLEFLDLGDRAPEQVPLHEATLQALSDKVAEAYEKEIKELPPVRSLVDDQRWVSREDRLPVAELEAIIDQVIATAGESSITIRLDEFRISAPLHQYGRTWMLAEEDGERYILAKGSNLEIRTKQASPLDVADLGSVEQAASELDLPWS
jgi:hypothetical protein